jgi:hypothetical protein
MNKIIPVFNPFITSSEWFPWLDLSRCTSRHQRYEIVVIITIDTKIVFISTLFIRISPESTKHNPPFDARMGQGLISTK